MRNQNGKHAARLPLAETPRKRGVASRNWAVNLVTSMDVRCQFSTQTGPTESHVHHPRFANFAKVAISRRRWQRFGPFLHETWPMSLFHVRSVLV